MASPINFNVGNAGQQPSMPQGQPPIPQQPSTSQVQPPVSQPQPSIPQGQPPIPQQPSMPQGQPPIQQNNPVPQGQPPIQQNLNGVQPPQQPQQAQQSNNSNKKESKFGNLFGGKKQASNEPVVMDEQYMQQQYKAYRTRKVAVFWTLIIGTGLLVLFGIFNTFFQEKYTDANAVNAFITTFNQTQSQQWDSGVQGFLQRNMKDLLQKYFKTSGTVKKFEVNNISVEYNMPKGKELFMCFFSADVAALGGETTRVYFTLPVLALSDGFHVGGDLLISEKKPYGGNGIDITDETPEDKAQRYLWFDDQKLDDKAGDAFESTARNFFTLGYNDPRHDVSDIYKGEGQLEFNGHFENIVDCKVYSEPNKLGFNAYVEYYITLPNGVAIDNHAYMRIEQNSAGSYNILQIY